MKINFKPKSYLGKWSIGLVVVMPILIYIGMSFVKLYKGIPAGETILQDIIKRPGVALSMLSGFTSGIIAFLVGIVSIIKRKECSVFVFLSTAVGFLTLLWCIAQFSFPH